MIVTNTETIVGYEIIEIKGLVQGNTVRAKHAGRDIAASFKNLVGGELKGYTELLTESRRQAVERMLAQAEQLGAKIRAARLELIPYIFVVGPRDQQAQTVSVRDRLEGDLGAMPIATAMVRLDEEIAAKQVRQVASGASAGFSEKGRDNEY